MTERFRLPRSLNAKMFYVILLALLTAAATFFAAKGLGDLAVDRLYMSPESASARKAQIYSRFSSFVTENGVRGDDAAAIASWSYANRYISIHIYDEESPPGDERIPEDKLYPMRFSDGVYHIAIDDRTESREYSLNRMIAAALASIAFLAILLWYVRRLSFRIIRLSREAVEIGAGDLARPITVSGEDELSMLAAEMDNMRRSVIERMSSERMAWEANSELITAISHDIRTPMTSLIGYLGLLNESAFDDPEQVRPFAASAYGKAMELKDLTDELFKYFLVFGRSSPEMDMQPFEAPMLLGQLVSEAEFDLNDAGFSIRHIDFEGDCRIRTDPMYLKRVLDNMVSNIKKYADPKQPVIVLSERKDGWLYVCFSNHIAQRTDQVESTRIGLRTCEKILSLMGGSFTVHRDEKRFTAELKLPVLPEEKQ